MTLGIALLIFFIVAAVCDCLYCNLTRRAPFNFPFIGHLPQLAYYYSVFHDTAVDWFKESERKYKQHFIHVQCGWYNVMATADPRDVEHMLKGNWQNYTVSRGLRGLALKDMLGSGIFHADGNSWYIQRKTASREFSASIFRDFMAKEFMLYAKKLLSVLEQNDGKVVDASALFFKLTLDSFGKVAFGKEIGGLDGKPIPFAASFDVVQNNSARRVVTLWSWWNLKKMLGIGSEKEMKHHLQIIDSFVYGLIADRKKELSLSQSRRGQNPDESDDDVREDLLSRLMMVSDSNDDPNLNSDTYLRDMTVNFLIAGRDTTACCLSWFLWEVVSHPRVLAAVRHELDQVFSHMSGLPYDSLTQDCPYLTACLNETLRLHPSVPFNIKNTEKDDVFPSGMRVKAGDTVAYTPYVMARMKYVWGDDAAEFKPERWLDENGEVVQESRFKFPAFQAGPRLCLGVDMAMLEMRVAIATILPRIDFEFVEKPTYKTGLVLQTLSGCKVKVSKVKK